MNSGEEWRNIVINLTKRKYEEEPNRAKEYNNWNKNTLEGINSRSDDTEEQLSELEDRVVEITEGEQKRDIFKWG